MYCKYCGQHNASDESYCQSCGNSIKINTVNIEKRKIVENATAYCQNCGTEILHRYCTSCGTVGYDLKLSQETKFKVPELNINKETVDGLKSKFQESPLGDIKNVDDVKDMVMKSQPIIKTSLLATLKILGIGLLISFLLFMAIGKIQPVQMLFNGIDYAASYGYPQISKLKPNFVDVFNLSLLSPTRLALNFQGEDYGEKIAIGAKMIMSFKILILLIIPAIGVIVGQWKLFKDEKTSRENISKYALTSLFFAIITNIITLVNRKSIKIADPYEEFQFKLSLSFQSIWSVFSIFMIIFLMHVIISMIMKKDNPFEIFNIKQYPDLGNKLYTYVKSMGIYIGIVTAVIIIVLIFLGIKGGETGLALLMGIVMAPAVFVHAWMLSFGYSMNTVLGMGASQSLNIGQAWKTIGIIKKFSYSGGSGALWGYLSIIALLIGLIYVIYKVLKDVETEGYFIKLAYIAGGISVLNIVFSYLGSMGLKASSKVTGESYYSMMDILYEFGLNFLSPLVGAGEIKQSYSILTIIIMTFIWIFAIGSIIYFVRDKEIYQKTTNIMDQYRRRIPIGYTVVVLLFFYLAQAKMLDGMAQAIFNIFPMLDILL